MFNAGSRLVGPTANFQPAVAVSAVAAPAANRQTALGAPILDPVEAVRDRAGPVALVAGSDPAIAAVVAVPPAGGQIRDQKGGVPGGVPDEAVQHRLDVPLSGMRPDGIREEEVEPLAEHRRVEIGIAVEPRR